MAATEEVVTLGGGCFWCLEAIYEQVRGVARVESGYAGGLDPHPTYEEVCTGRTGHAEVVQVTFEPDTVSLPEILEIFFTIHDPTTKDRQGADVGPQYRSVIFYHSAAQKAIAEAAMRRLQEEGVWEDPIVTELAPFRSFHPAEDYHRSYFRRNPAQPYCRAVVAPKVAKFRAHWAGLLRPAPEGPGAAKPATPPR